MHHSKAHNKTFLFDMGKNMIGRLVLELLLIFPPDFGLKNALTVPVLESRPQPRLRRDVLVYSTGT